MNKRIFSIYRFSAYLLMLGVIHSALTPLFYHSLSPDALWFFGTGLSLVFLSLLNIAASKVLEVWLLSMTLIANIVGTVFSFMIAMVLKEFQAYIGLVFSLIVTSACWVVRQQMVRSNQL